MSGRLGFADDFRLGRRFDGGRSLFELARGARGLDREDDRLGSREQSKALGQHDVAGGNVIVNAQRRDVDLEVLRDAACRPFDLQLVGDHIHDGAGVSNALGNPDGYDREPRVDRFVGRNPLKIGVYDAARDRMALNLAHQCGLPFAAAVGERQNRVAAGAMNHLFEGPRVDGDVLGDRAVSIKYRRNLARRSQRLCSGGAELLDGARRKDSNSLLATASFISERAREPQRLLPGRQKVAWPAPRRRKAPRPTDWSLCGRWRRQKSARSKAG